MFTVISPHSIPRSNRSPACVRSHIPFLAFVMARLAIPGFILFSQLVYFLLDYSIISLVYITNLTNATNLGDFDID